MGFLGPAVTLVRAPGRFLEEPRAAIGMGLDYKRCVRQSVETQNNESAVPSFDDLFRLYAPFVWRVLGRLGVHQADLHDASQEVFLVVHKRLDSFEGRSSVKTWIFGICARVGAAFRRKIHRWPEIDEEASVLATDQAPDDAIDSLRLRERLRRALGTLDDEKRAVFVLYELEDLSMPEIAEAVGCPLTTAYSRLHAARKVVKSEFLRQNLAEPRGT